MTSKSTSNNRSTLNRRKILGWGCTGLAAAAVGTHLWPDGNQTTASRTQAALGTGDVPSEANAASESPPSSLSDRDVYLPHVGTTFEFSSGSEDGISCTLVNVGPEQIQEAPTARFASYSLVFTAAKNRQLAEGIYRLKHAHLPEAEFFFSPVGPANEETHLEAVISRKVS